MHLGLANRIKSADGFLRCRLEFLFQGLMEKRQGCGAGIGNHLIADAVIGNVAKARCGEGLIDFGPNRINGPVRARQ